jgi:hypothetical protein
MAVDHDKDEAAYMLCWLLLQQIRTVPSMRSVAIRVHEAAPLHADWEDRVKALGARIGFGVMTHLVHKVEQVLACYLRTCATTPPPMSDRVVVELVDTLEGLVGHTKARDLIWHADMCYVHGVAVLVSAELLTEEACDCAQTKWSVVNARCALDAICFDANAARTHRSPLW